MPFGSVSCTATRPQACGLVWVALPLGPRRTDHTATRARAFHHHTFTAEWQCTLFQEPPGAPVARTAVGTKECTQIGGNGLSEPFWGICVHCCAARVARVAMRVVTRAASGSTSASTTMRASDAPSVAASRLVGKTGSTRVTAPSWCLRRSVNQHKPPRSRINQHFLWLVPARLAGAYGDLPTEQPSVRKSPADSGALMLSPATPQIRMSVGKKNTIGDNFSPFGALLLALRAK